ncbi:hypothetical protein J6590_056785 [Homalodisca vitripennis]|nr:hypothetical protein J6590_056785 [Homalodisca vitripennis]
MAEDNEYKIPQCPTQPLNRHQVKPWETKLRNFGQTDRQTDNSVITGLQVPEYKLTYVSH